MNNKDAMKTFLNALEAVKRDFTCSVCSELCKKPVTLSKCFHLICSEHFNILTNCPTCGIELDGCETFTDNRMEACIDSTNQLSKIFEKFTPTEQTSTANVDEVISVKTVDDSATTPENSKTKTQNISIASSKFSKSVDKRNHKGETMLHVACRLGKADQIIELLNQGANTNTKDNAGWTPLHEIVQNNRLDLVQLLLKYNTLIDVPGQGNETPLHEAVRYKHAQIAEELVKYGADINARNCKGETPLELATDELKNLLINASENLIQTQSVNVNHMSMLCTEIDMEDIRVFCASEYRTVSNKLKMLSKHHNNLHVETKLSRKVSHLIVDAEDGVCTATLDVLQGIVSCIWILSSDWIMQSTEETLKPTEAYEVVGVGSKSYTGPKTARYNKYKLLPGLFDGCHFYLHNFNMKYEISKRIVVTKAVLSKLITDAGGIVLRRAPNPELIPDAEKLVPYHAKKDGKLINCSHYIIFKNLYEPMYNMQHLKALPIGWLIECIEKYELCEPW